MNTYKRNKLAPLIALALVLCVGVTALASCKKKAEGRLPELTRAPETGVEPVDAADASAVAVAYVKALTENDAETLFALLYGGFDSDALQALLDAKSGGAVADLLHAKGFAADDALGAMRENKQKTVDGLCDTYGVTYEIVGEVIATAEYETRDGIVDFDSRIEEIADGLEASGVAAEALGTLNALRMNASSAAAFTCYEVEYTIRGTKQSFSDTMRVPLAQIGETWYPVGMPIADAVALYCLDEK